MNPAFGSLQGRMQIKGYVRRNCSGIFSDAGSTPAASTRT